MTTRKKAPGKADKPKGNPAQRAKVMFLLASGAPVRAVAATLNMTVAQMTALYPQTVKMGAELGFCQLALIMWNEAKNGKVSAIDKLMARAERTMADDSFVKPEEDEERRLPVRQRMGKKELAQLEAETAGQGTGWGEDLQPPTARLN